VTYLVIVHHAVAQPAPSKWTLQLLSPPSKRHF